MDPASFASCLFHSFYLAGLRLDIPVAVHGILTHAVDRSKLKLDVGPLSEPGFKMKKWQRSRVMQVRMV